MSQWNSEEDAAKAVAGGGWSNGPGHQQTKNSQPTAMETDENNRAREQNGPNSRGWGPSSDKPNSIVVDEQDTESWPAIPGGGKPGEEPKTPSSSASATVSASLPTSSSHNAMDAGQTAMVTDNTPASSGGMMNSIWRNSSGSSAGWEGGITTSSAMGKTVTTPTSQYQQQQQGGFGGHNSAWDPKAPTPGVNPGATTANNSGDPSSGWLGEPRPGATPGGLQDGPKSSAGGVPGINSAPDTHPRKDGSATNTSESGWMPNSEPGLGFGSNPGATNTTNSANQPWNVPSRSSGFGAGNAATWNKPGNTPQGGGAMNGSGWGNPPAGGSSWPSSSSQPTGSSSWNTPASSSNTNSMGWGSFKPENNNTSGWGDSNPSDNNSSQQGSGWGKPDLATKGWGDSKPDTGASQWGAPLPPSNRGGSGWGDSSGPNNRPEPSGWGNPPPSGGSNHGWGGGPPGPPGPQPPNSWAGAASKGVEGEKPVPNSLQASLDPTAIGKVSSNDGWGKTQINQTAKWDTENVQQAGDGHRGDDGTAAWGQTQNAGPPSTRPAWGKEAPSAWGNPSQAPPPKPSGWGNQPPPTSQPPPPAWGNTNTSQPPDNPNPGGRAWVVNSNNSSNTGGGGNSQWGKPPAAPSTGGGWGNSNPSGPDNGTNAWGRPPPSQWGDNQPPGPPPNGPPPSGPPPRGPPPTGPTGPPPSGPPPSGPPPSGLPPAGMPPSGPPPGALPSGPPPGPPPPGPPPSGPPPSNTDQPTSPLEPRIITGCSWQNMASTTVATGWGELAPEQPRKISADDGTYAWGDSNEHNMRITQSSRVNINRQQQPGGRPHSTMQQGDQPSARPPSQVESGPSAWGDSGSSNSQWGNVTAKGDDGTAAWGAPSSGGSKPAGIGQWDDSTSNSPWGRSSTSASTKDTMQSGGWNPSEDHNPGPGGPGGSGIGHWNDGEDNKWESHSHSSESSVSSSGWRGGRKPGKTAQRESNHWISKLKRLMDHGYRKEEAEMALRKHNMHFESALNDLRHGGDFGGQKSDLDSQFSQMNIGGLLPGDKTFGDNVPPNSSMPPSSMLPNSTMPNAPGVAKPGYGQGLGLSNNPANSLMQQQGQQQPFGGLQQQVAPNQQLRSPFNPQQLLQQQQQQQAFLQLAVQAGLINQSLLQQQLTPQLFMAVFQLIQQQMQRYQQLQNLPNKGMGGLNTTRQQHELILRLAAMQQLLQQQPQQQQQNQQRPVQHQQQQRTPFPPRNKSDSDMFSSSDIPSGGGFNQDLGIKDRESSRLQQFFNQQRSLSTSGKPPDAFGMRTDSVASTSDMSQRSDGWSRSNSPTASDHPRSADSAFSESAGWSFPPANNDIPADLTDIGPPEFKPGVPWKPRTKDVANDPHATPGSVNNGILATPNLSKTENRNSRDDDLTGILTKPMKPPPAPTSGSNWSTGGMGGPQQGGYKKAGWNYSESTYTPTKLTNEIWKAPLNQGSGARNVRPPPGLVEPQPSNSPWQQGNQVNPGRNWNRSQSTTGTSWSSPGGGGDALNNWLVLRNLTPQIDGSTLRLLCNQHGPLEHFYLNLSQGTALIAYRTPDEAMKAQRTLHSCVLGNTTIIVDFATAADVSRIKDRTVSTSGGGGWSKGGGGGGVSSGYSSGGGNQWNGGSSLPGLPGGGAMWSTGGPNNMWGGDEGDSTNSFLPGGLLSGDAM